MFPAGPASRFPTGQPCQAGQLTTKVAHNLPSVACPSNHSCQQTHGHFNHDLHKDADCGSLFKGRRMYKKRSNSGHGGFACSRCPRTFVSKGGRTEHMKHIHEKQARYKCDYCGKGFTNLSRCSDHLALHTGVKQHACTICQKQFTFRDTLKIHVLKHHPNEAAQM